MASPEISRALLAQGMDPTPRSPEELRAYVKSEIAKWTHVIKARGIKAE
ncbi:MAG: hypothetical protein ABIH03_16140 [Pseudomonadota bacterium]